MTLSNKNPLVLGAMTLLGLSLAVLGAVLLPSLVFVGGITPEAPIDSARFAVSRQNTEPLANYTAIASQSLFNEGRRPDPLPPPPAPAKPALPGVETYRLVGLILSPDLRIALVERGGEVMHLHSGDPLDGWTVQSVEAEGVKLAAQNTTVELKIPKAAARQPAASDTKQAAIDGAATPVPPAAAVPARPFSGIATPVAPYSANIARTHR